MKGKNSNHTQLDFVPKIQNKKTEVETKKTKKYTENIQRNKRIKNDMN